jgi:hypothetical protein
VLSQLKINQSQIVDHTYDRSAFFFNLHKSLSLIRCLVGGEGSALTPGVSNIREFVSLFSRLLHRSFGGQLIYKPYLSPSNKRYRTSTTVGNFVNLNYSPRMLLAPFNMNPGPRRPLIRVGQCSQSNFIGVNVAENHTCALFNYVCIEFQYHYVFGNEYQWFKF